MILVAGSANLDHVIRVPELPKPGETLLATSYETAPGGKGANQAVAAARAGGTVSFLGAVGQDVAGDVLLAALAGNGVQTDLIERVPGPSGQAFISVSQDGENYIAVVAGANDQVRPDRALSLAGVDSVVLQLEIPLPAVTAVAAAAQAQDVKVILNAAPAQVLPAALLECTDVLVVNQHELATVSGLDAAPEEAARALLPRGPSVVVVTLGASGCLAVTPDETIRQAAFKVTPVDTTGAGDTFTGVLATRLSEGNGLAEALRAATAAAAISCTRPTAQGGMPARDEIEQLLAASA
jgi:ribokinase